MKSKFFFLSLFLFLFIFPINVFAWFAGPYTGQVIDNQTGQPIEGASVLIFWTENVISIPESHTNFLKAKIVYTDKKGNYKIPINYLNLSLIGTLEYTHLVIYQPGYIFFRDVYLHGRSQLNQTFREKNYLVKLDRITPNVSHYDHYNAIDNAFNGIYEYPYSYPRKEDFLMTWGKMIKDKMKGSVEMQEFLLRTEWEDRRGMEEWRERSR